MYVIVYLEFCLLWSQGGKILKDTSLVLLNSQENYWNMYILEF